jgi:hypothetical protein
MEALRLKCQVTEQKRSCLLGLGRIRRKDQGAKSPTLASCKDLIGSVLCLVLEQTKQLKVTSHFPIVLSLPLPDKESSSDPSALFLVSVWRANLLCSAPGALTLLDGAVLEPQKANQDLN